MPVTPRKRGNGGSDPGVGKPPDSNGAKKDAVPGNGLGIALLHALDQSPDLVILVTAEGNCIHKNQSATRQLPAARGETMRCMLALFPVAESQATIREGLRTAFEKGSWSGETLMTGRNGLETPVSVVITSAAKSEGEAVALVQLRDLSTRYSAESALAGALLRSQDEERRRIGRELHDSTAQVLAALEIGLSRLERVFDSNHSPHTDTVRECIRLAARCSLELRTMSALLHPPLLEDLGLCNTLRWHVSRFSDRSGIQTELEAPDDDTRWPGNIELTLFRIVQESLSNILRHSESKRATIRLGTRGRNVRLEVEDYGKGLPEKIQRQMDSPGTGVGLSGMRQRVRELNGRFSIESKPGLTRIIATIPLPSESP